MSEEISSNHLEDNSVHQETPMVWETPMEEENEYQANNTDSPDISIQQFTIQQTTDSSGLPPYQPTIAGNERSESTSQNNTSICPNASETSTIKTLQKLNELSIDYFKTGLLYDKDIYTLTQLSREPLPYKWLRIEDINRNLDPGPYLIKQDGLTHPVTGAVINLHLSVLVVFTDHPWEYFDSRGIPLHDIPGIKINSNDTRFQHKDYNTCGLYAVYFLRERIKLGSLEKVKESFPTQRIDSLRLNEEYILKYYRKMFKNYFIRSGNIIVANIVKKTNSRYKFLFRQNKWLNLKSRKLLWSALILCHFDYSCSAWYTGLTKKLKIKLQTLKKKTIRFINDMLPRQHISQGHKKSKLLNIENRIIQLKLNHVHKIYHKNCNFNRVKDLHSHNTRSSIYNIVVPNKTSDKSTFYGTGIKLWKDLPNEINSIKNMQNFKHAIINHFHVFKNLNQ